MFKIKFAASILVMAATSVAAASSATGMQGNNCGARDTVLGYLSTKYAEKPIAMGVAANGSLIEVLSSKKGSTFTIIVTVPDGKTCMVAAGEGWEDLLGPVNKGKKNSKI